MKKINTRVAAGVGLAGAAIMGLTSLGAGGAAAGPLPGGFVSKTLVDGTKVNVRLSGEFVNIQKAVTNVVTSREVWVSGKVKVNVSGQADGGSITAGYMVGCQVDFGGSAGAEGSQSLGPDVTTIDPKVDGTAGFKLGPGQASYVPVINTTSGDNKSYEDYEVNDYTFKGKSGGVVYSQEKFGLDGCAGHASAKAVVKVKVKTDSVKSIVTLYGKPFSLG